MESGDCSLQSAARRRRPATRNETVCKRQAFLLGCSRFAAKDSQMTRLRAKRARAAAIACAGALLLAGCGEGAPAGAKPITLTAENFNAEVLQSDKPVLVDFWAAWCAPCRRIAPFVDQLAAEYQGRAKIGKVDVDRQKTLAVRFRIEVLPTLLIFADGKVVTTIRKQVITKRVLADALNAALK